MNNEFDLEWLERGGVVVFNDDLYRYLNSGEEKTGDKFFLICPIYMFGPVPVLLDKFQCATLLRMAEKEECDAANVKYIPPPARWLPIESAPMEEEVLIKCSLLINESHLEESVPKNAVKAKLVDNAWFVVDSDFYSIEAKEVTGWMPLPPK